jgi:hypothetical protein
VLVLRFPDLGIFIPIFRTVTIRALADFSVFIGPTVKTSCLTPHSSEHMVFREDTPITTAWQPYPKMAALRLCRFIKLSPLIR